MQEMTQFTRFVSRKLWILGSEPKKQKFQPCTEHQTKVTSANSFVLSTRFQKENFPSFKFVFSDPDIKLTEAQEFRSFVTLCQDTNVPSSSKSLLKEGFYHIGEVGEFKEPINNLPFILDSLFSFDIFLVHSLSVVNLRLCLLPSPHSESLHLFCHIHPFPFRLPKIIDAIQATSPFSEKLPAALWRGGACPDIWPPSPLPYFKENSL